MFSLNEKLAIDILEGTLPSFQDTDPDTANLGFGLLYYALARILRPQTSVVIGSKAGFSPVMFGLGVKDNEGTGVGKISCYRTESKSREMGRVYFVDPSYSINRDDKNHWYGVGAWDDEDAVRKQWDRYQMDDVIQHYKMTSADFAQSSECPQYIDLLYIDGDHSYQGMSLDLSLFAEKLRKDALVIMHDVDTRIKELVSDAGGAEVYSEVSHDKFEKIRLPIFPGLAILKKK